jgi:hypothetical protein
LPEVDGGEADKIQGAFEKADTQMGDMERRFKVITPIANDCHQHEEVPTEEHVDRRDFRFKGLTAVAD